MKDAMRLYTFAIIQARLVASLPLSQACNLSVRAIPGPWHSRIGRREIEPLLHLHMNEDTTGICTWTLDEPTQAQRVRRAASPQQSRFGHHTL